MRPAAAARRRAPPSWLPRRVSRTPHAAAGVTRSSSALERDYICAVGVGWIQDHREPEVRRQPGSDVRPGLAGIVGPVDAAVKLHEQPLGLLRSAVQAMDAEVVSVLRPSSGM